MFASIIDRETIFYFKALGLLLGVAFAFGFLSAYLYPEAAQETVTAVAEEFGVLDELTLFEIFMLIFLNNAFKSFVVMVLGIAFGVLPVIFILLNGYAIGIIVAVSLAQSGVAVVLFGTVPHGIFEVPAVLVAASYGVLLGEKALYRIKHGESLGVHVYAAIGKFSRYVVPFLALAALIETALAAWINTSI